MADIYTLESSSMSQQSDQPFLKKDWVSIPDVNNTNYASNIVSFDTSALYNSQKFVNPSEMMVSIPLVAVISTNAAAPPANPISPYSLGFKNGYHNIISACQITYDGNTVQQIQLNSNYYVSFKMASSLSQNDVKADGSTLGFSMDSSTSWKYSNTTSKYGLGSSNNNNILTSSLSMTTYGGEAYNAGLLTRQYRTSFDPTQSGGLTSSAITSQSLRPYFSYTSGNTYAVYYVIATIRLKDISNFFERSPLTKGFYSRIDLTLNTGSFRVSTNPGALSATAPVAATANLPGPNFAPATSYSFSMNASDINFPNGTCPLMLSQAYIPTTPAYTTWTGGASVTTAAVSPTEAIVGLYVAKVTSSVPGINPGGVLVAAVNHSQLNIPPHTQTTCLLYAPVIELKPERALSYITQNRNKLISYETLNNQSFYNIFNGNSFNLNITTGLSNVVGILAIPFISASSNSGFSPCISPYASEPATSSPCLMLSNFNVQVSGVNVLQKNLIYDHEFFLQELYGENAINGNLTTGLKSGLIDQLGFENIFRYYYVNLERRSDDNVSKKSITMSGQNLSGVNIDIFTCIITRNSLVLDVETGKIVAQGLESQY